jgi:hypothetical protein
LVPSDCTLILLGFKLRLLAVNHHPVGDLFQPSILKPLSSSRFCVAHISGATVANAASSSFAQISGVVTAGGAVHNVKLTRLLTQDEVTHVRQTAAKLRGAYKPPGK